MIPRKKEEENNYFEIFNQAKFDVRARRTLNSEMPQLLRTVCLQNVFRAEKSRISVSASSFKNNLFDFLILCTCESHKNAGTRTTKSKKYIYINIYFALGI